MYCLKPIDGILVQIQSYPMNVSQIKLMFKILISDYILNAFD